MMKLLWTISCILATTNVLDGTLFDLVKKRTRRNWDPNDEQLAVSYWQAPVQLGIFINNDYVDSGTANLPSKRTDTPFHPSDGSGSGSGSYFFSDEKRNSVPKPKNIIKERLKKGQIMKPKILNEKKSELTAQAAKMEVQDDADNSQKHSTVTCQGQKDWLQCPMYQLIKIENAFWGRDDTTSCSRSAIEHGLQTDKMCAQDETNTMAKVQNSCDGENACELIGSPVYFDKTDCPEVYKFLRVNWQCVHSETRIKDDIPNAQDNKKEQIENISGTL